MEHVLPDKENLLQGSQIPSKQEVRHGTPRTPLSKLNGPSRSAKALRKSRYSYVTPVSTPCSPSDKLRRRVRSDGSSSEPKSGQLLLDTKGVQLNALVYQQVVKIVDDLKQEHEKLVKVKDSHIAQLEGQLKTARMQSHQNQEVPDDFDEEVDKYVDDIIQKVARDLEQERKLTENLAHRLSVPQPDSSTGQTSLHSALNDTADSESVFTSPALRPDLLQRAISGMCKKLQSLSDDESGEPEISTASPYRTTSMEHTIPPAGIKHRDCNTMTSPISVATVNTATMVTPVNHKHIDVMTEQFSTQNTACSPIGRLCGKTCSVETMITPVTHKSVTLMTDQVETDTVSTSPIVIMGSRNEHQKQLTKLEEEKAEYREHYYSSQQRVKELDAKLEMYEELTEVCSKVKQSQLEVQTVLMLGFQKMSKLAKEHEEKQSKLHLMYDEQLRKKDEEKTKVDQQLTESQAESELLRDKLQVATTTIENLNAELLALQKSKDNVVADLENTTLAKENLTDKLKVIVTVKEALAEELQAAVADKISLDHEHQLVVAANEHLTSRLKAGDLEREELETKLATVQEELAACEERLSSTSHALTEANKDNSHISGLLSDAKQLLDHRAKESKLMTELLEESEKNMKELQDKLDNNVESLEQEKRNLFHTLESRESDLDSITQERDQLAKLTACQKLACEGLRKDLQRTQKAVTSLKEVQEQLKILEDTSKENQEFLEQEKAGLIAELDEKEQAVRALDKTCNNLTAENNQLKAQVDTFSKKCSDVETELDETKARAHFMLFRQNAEIIASVVSLNKLSELLQGLQGQVSQSLQQQMTLKEAYNSSKAKDDNSKLEDLEGKEKSKSKASHRKSFVCSILGVMRDSNQECKQQEALPEVDETESGVSQAQVSEEPSKPTIGTSGSAFSRVQSSAYSDNSSNNGSSEAGSLLRGDSIERSLSVETGTSDSSKERTEEKDDSQNLQKLLEGVDTVVSNIISTFQQLDVTLMDQVSHLQTEVRNAQNQLELEQSRCKSMKVHVSSLEGDIRQMNINENNLRQEITRIRQQVAQRDSELREAQVLIMDRTTKLEAAAEQIRTSKREGWEMERLTQLCHDKDTELTVIRRTLEDTLAHMVTTQGDLAATSAREIVHLRKENATLQNEVGRSQAKMEVSLQKCVRRMDAYKCNWEKAEKEVSRLDDLVERLSQAFSRHSEYVLKCRDLRQLVNELGVQLKEGDSALSGHQPSDR